ncbi:uncharacterized protein LOC118280836 isoform X2 [Spodoptera frugiperda]|uniref:Uncharacterized protein LOC118280836 isoform X2 n=1 Tax=Spodoptera frugiperda TaxID=7108 RepID=A0A9R0DJM4_SPOFR|nr:uncharacterized protein LOC118280836 isoform X2 [Spodoptera frugiperda]
MCDIGDSIFFTETPILEKFFSTLERGAINYCIVCLRTENERLLVRPQYFMRFARAMKIEKYWKHNFICNYCERQAYLAVRFYTATRLSASVDTIFAELLYQKKRKVANVFSERQFRNVLWSCDVENKNATPAYYEKQLRKIHYAADYAYQKAVVIDNFGIHIKDPIGKMTKTVECRGGYKQTVTRVVDRDRFGQLIKQADVGVQTDITMDTMVISEALVDKRLKLCNTSIFYCMEKPRKVQGSVIQNGIRITGPLAGENTCLGTPHFFMIVAFVFLCLFIVASVVMVWKLVTTYTDDE